MPAHSTSALSVGDEAADGFGQLLHGGGRNEVAAPPLVDQLGQTTDAGRYHRKSRGHGLENGIGRALSMAGEDEQVAFEESLQHLIAREMPCGDHVGGRRFDRLPDLFRDLPDEDKVDMRQLVAQRPASRLFPCRPRAVPRRRLAGALCSRASASAAVRCRHSSSTKLGRYAAREAGHWLFSKASERTRHRDVDVRHSHQPAKPQPRSGREAIHDVGQTAVIVHDQRHASHPHEAGHHQISPDAERRNAAVDVNDLWAAEDEAACHTDDETDRVQDLDDEPAAVDGPKPADPLEQKAAARFRSTDSEDALPRSRSRRWSEEGRRPRGPDVTSYAKAPTRLGME